MKLKFKILAAVFALFAFHSQANADIYLGGLVGFGTAAGSATNYSGGVAAGATAGVQLVPNLGVAGTYIHDFLSAGSTSAGASQYLVEGNFFTLLFFPSGIHFGDVTTTSASGGTSSDIGMGVHTGFDIHIVSNVSIGATLYWTYVTQTNDHHSLINLLVPVKFHF